MKKLTVLAIFGVALLSSAFLTPGVWVTYTSVEGHFSMSFPGKPEESVEDEKSDNGNTFKMHLVSYSPSDNEVYMAGWVDLTSFYPDDKPIKEMLENSRDGAAKSMGATDVKNIKTDLGKEPYIEFTFRSKDLVGKDRIYLVHKYQYSIITIFSASKGIPPSADQFIRSFKYSN